MRLQGWHLVVLLVVILLLFGAKRLPDLARSVGQSLKILKTEVKDHDPRAALDGGADGLDAYRAIATDVAAHLAEDGRIAVEIGHTQKADVTAIFEAAGFGLTEARRDLGERDRVLVFAAQGRIAAPPK